MADIWILDQVEIVLLHTVIAHRHRQLAHPKHCGDDQMKRERSVNQGIDGQVLLSVTLQQLEQALWDRTPRHVSRNPEP